MDAACVVCDVAPVAPGGLYCPDCQPTPSRSVQGADVRLFWHQHRHAEALSQQCWADACSRQGVTPTGLCEAHRDLFREPA